MKVKLLNEDAKVPARGSVFSAGLDLFSCEEIMLPPGSFGKIKTGIAIETQIGTVGLIWPRSKLGAGKGIQVLAGVIDSDYRGEVIVALLNSSKESITLKKGEAVAQLLIQNISLELPLVVDKLTETVRGSEGINSTDQRTGVS